MCDILMSRQFMPCRSTKCPSLVRLGNVCHRSIDVRHGLVFFNISVYPGHLSHVGQQSAHHRVVFSTLGLYLAHLATQVNKLSIRDLLVSTFISSRYTQVYPWWSLAGVWYDQFVVHSNCIWALVRSDDHRFLPLLAR